MDTAAQETHGAQDDAPSTLINVRVLVLAACLILALNAGAIALNLPLVRQGLSFISLFLIPGLFITLLFEIRCRRLVEYGPLIVGLSVAFLLFAGLALNQLFAALGIRHPLAPPTIIAAVLICNLLWAVLILTSGQREWRVQWTVPTVRPAWLLFFIPTLFPLWSTIGALNLNNAGDHTVALATVILMAVYALIVVWRHDDLPPHILEYSILMMGLALLLSYSLRSTHISGWDINQEFYVYQLTESQQQWRIELFRDPYNACLSITILPTVLNAFLGINSEFIFKLVFQLIFALVPLIVYLIARNYLHPVLAYLSSLFFVFQPWLIQPTPALARQEIGLLFFGLLVWSTFYSGFRRRQREGLMIVFGVTLIVAHYSTSYITIGMLVATFVLSLVLRALYRVLRRPLPQSMRFIPGTVILILVAVLFFWNNILTGTMGNVSFVAQSTLFNFRAIFAGDLRSEDIGQALGLGVPHNTPEQIADYVHTQTELYKDKPGLYPANRTADYVASPLNHPEPGGILANPAVQSALALVLTIIKQGTKILLIVGALVLLYRLFRFRGMDYDYILLNLISVGVLLAFLFIPVLSLYYNVFRVYMQTLIVSSISLVIGGTTLLWFLSRKTRARLIGVLLIVFFLSSTGALSYLIGGSVTMNVSDTGEDYNKFYTHEGEVDSALWLARHRQSGVPIYADDIATLRLTSFGGGIVDTETVILPTAFTIDSYVYLRFTNLALGLTEAVHKGSQISYNVPLEFLDANKSLIYDNGGSRIYK